jgi:hypothetical protein
VKISDLRNGMLDFGLQLNGGLLNGEKLQENQGVSIRNVGTFKTFS